MLVYQTENFKKRLSKDFPHLKENVENFISQLEQLPFQEAISRLDRHPPYLKHRIGKFRIIAKILTPSEINIKSPTLVLIEIMQRGNNEYDEFNWHTSEYGEKYLQPIIETEINQIENYVNNSTISEPEPELPSEFLKWFYPSHYFDTSERLIYESVNWYNKTFNSDFNISRFYDILIAILDNNQSEVEITTIDKKVSIATLRRNQNFVVIYTCFLLPQYNSTDNYSEVYFLIDALWNGKPSEEYISKISENIPAQDSNINLETLAKLSYRAYPDYILADEKIWGEIEKDEQANLALSSEEELILKKILNPSTPELPIFISGRAGSGKSTLLYYLFADFIARKFANECEGDPLFLTYSKPLLETAEKSILKILNLNYNYRSTSSQTLTQIEENKIKNFFKTFHQLLIENLPPDNAEKFKKDKMVSIFKFKSFWERNKNYLPKNISPELAWFTIRAYIKGYSDSDEFMDPEQYSELPRKEKAIPEEKFEEIYNTIFKWYDKLCKEHNLWDDQDLVREVLKNKNLPSFPVIFCDEAQDFTRIELRLIMKLSTFSKYKLSQLNTLPFVFAGDPMQTINPTGFRWETTKTIFHEEIIEMINKGRTSIPTINFEELHYNYRSTPAITKFSNSILMWRSALSKIDSKPQIPWRTIIDENSPENEGPKPSRFIIDEIINDEKHKNELLKLLKEKIVIIPAEEDQLTNFIEEDPILKEIFPSISDNNPPKNIFTAISAKGLEFDDIIIYKFGEKLQNSISEIINSQPSFENEFYLNKLYVAISRAKKHLFIVDTINGNEKLWKYLSDLNLITDFLPHDFNLTPWIKYITTLMPGDISHLTYSKTEKENIASELMRNGISRHDPELLHRAHDYYQELREIENATICLAYAHKYEEKYAEAANYFKKINKLYEAKECLLQGKLWNDLVAFYEEHPELKRDINYEFALFIINQNLTTDSFLRFHNFLIRSKNDIQPHDEIINIAIDKYINFLLNADTNTLNTPTWHEAASLLKEKFIYNPNACRASAKSFFISNDFKNACELWEKIKETEHKNYYIAKSKLYEPPDNLKYMLKAEMYEEIINLWHENGEPITEPWFTHIIQPLRKINPDKIIEIYLQIYAKNNPIKVIDEYSENIKSKNPDQILKLLNLIFQKINQHPNLSLEEKIKLYLPLLNESQINNIPQEELLKIFIDFPGKTIIETDSKFDEKPDISDLFEKFLSDYLKKEKIDLWKKYLSTNEIASILERTLPYKSSLEFYYNYIEKHAKIPQFRDDIINAKDIKTHRNAITKIKYNEDLMYILKRIGKVLLKRAKYHRDKKEEEKAQSFIEDVRTIAKNFEISLIDFENEPEYPQAVLDILGFDKTPLNKTITESEIILKALIFEIRIKKDKKTILLLNTENYETKRLEIEQLPNQYEYTTSYYKTEFIKKDNLYIKFFYKEDDSWSLEGTVILKSKTI